MLSIFYKFVLVLLLGLTALNHDDHLGNNDEYCNETRNGTMKLHEGTEHAGLVQICWKMENEEYRWYNVCPSGWLTFYSRIICSEFPFINEDNAGWLPYPCADTYCISQPKVSVGYKDKMLDEVENCEDHSLVLLVCDTSKLTPTILKYILNSEVNTTDRVGKILDVNTINRVQETLIIIIFITIIIIAASVVIGGLCLYFRKVKKSNTRNKTNNSDEQNIVPYIQNAGFELAQDLPYGIPTETHMITYAHLQQHDSQLRNVPVPRNRPGAYESITDVTKTFDMSDKTKDRIMMTQHYEMDELEIPKLDTWRTGYEINTDEAHKNMERESNGEDMEETGDYHSLEEPGFLRHSQMEDSNKYKTTGTEYQGPQNKQQEQSVKNSKPPTKRPEQNAQYDHLQLHQK